MVQTQIKLSRFDSFVLNQSSMQTWSMKPKHLPRFYTVGFLSTGSNYFYLLKAVHAWLQNPSTVVVEYISEWLGDTINSNLECRHLEMENNKT